MVFDELKMLIYLFFPLISKLFDEVKKIHPNYKSKLVAVTGDLSEPDLGISFQERQSIIDNVSIVFHSAATVRFDEPLR
jgi:fatty acyl-CoA reductase